LTQLLPGHALYTGAEHSLSPSTQSARAPSDLRRARRLCLLPFPGYHTLSFKA